MGSNELSEQEIRKVVTSFRVTLYYQLSYLRAIPLVLENPTVAPAVTKQVMRELRQDIERLRSTLDDLQEAEQWADKHGIKILNWENLNHAKAALEMATTYISERPN